MPGLNKSEIAQFNGLGTGQISDAMELMGIRRSVIVGFTFVAAADTLMVGTAFTVLQAPKHHPSDRSERLVRHGEVSDGLAAPGQVVVIDAGGRLDVASWGENHSIACHRRGVSGLLINGCVRDAAGIRTLGFTVFCLGFSPIKSQWDLETVAFNQPVTIGGVQIRPDDVVVGDEDGVIVIPQEAREAVVGKAQEIRAKELPGIPYRT